MSHVIFEFEDIFQYTVVVEHYKFSDAVGRIVYKPLDGIGRIDEDGENGIVKIFL